MRYELTYQSRNQGPWVYWVGPYTCKLKALKKVTRSAAENGQRITNLTTGEIIYERRGDV